MNPTEKSELTKACDSCGHPDGEHVFHAATEYPSEGWVTCPESGCECYSTWSLDDVSRPQMDQIREQYYKGLKEKDLKGE